MILNEKLDYAVRRSTVTSRQYVRQPSARSNATASLRFKSGDLKALHLDRAALNLAFQLEEKHRKVASSSENSTEKHRTKNEKKQHHKAGNKNGHHKQQRRQYAHNSSARHTIMAPCHSTFDISSNESNVENMPRVSLVDEASVSAQSLSKLKVGISISMSTHAERNRERRELRLQDQRVNHR